MIEKIQYKAENVGIDVIVREESYTSKASSFDMDKIPNSKTEKKHKFSGRRIKRGLYKTKEGLLINADINAAVNILRKEIGDDFVKNIFDKGCMTQPKLVNPLALERNPRVSETLPIAS